MKKIRVKTVIYDRTTHEWVQKTITRTISDELAAMIQKEFSSNPGDAKYEVSGFGCGDDRNKRIQGLSTPLASQKRYWIEPQFHVIDENDNEIAEAVSK